MSPLHAPTPGISPTATPAPRKGKGDKGRSPVALRVAGPRKVTQAGGHDRGPAQWEGWKVMEEVTAKALRRGGPGGPEPHPFYPLAQLIFVGPLPSSFLTSSPCPPLPLCPRLRPSRSHPPKLLPPSLCGMQMKRVALWPCPCWASLLSSREAPSCKGGRQWLQSCPSVTVCAEPVCPLALRLRGRSVWRPITHTAGRLLPSMG